STLTEKGAKETLDALHIGAVDYVTKPTKDLKDSFHSLSKEICFKVKTAAKANIKNRSREQANIPIMTSIGKSLPQLVAIGASTGGVEALSEIFLSLPSNCPPIVVVQHMPPGFTTSFAARMDRLCAPSVFEATQNMRIEKGHIYIAPGDRHLRIKHASSALVVDLADDDGPVSGHKPSVDVLFESVAILKLRSVFGVILTGMGRDGAKGLLTLRQSGGKTFGQNEKSCLIYGMPRAAMEMGSVEKEVPLKEMASLIMGNESKNTV
ncbi:MAG: chemotaxis-specific protein-glutamate methyltransferase CheB, partial [Alphaproteobacteria bacterium]|nr:chemotaxis-specific protein-glutamate methyltransferase CheB [Alphaproteobacteria bacterium]